MPPRKPVPVKGARPQTIGKRTAAGAARTKKPGAKTAEPRATKK
jgi:hypothetical protein